MQTFYRARYTREVVEFVGVPDDDQHDVIVRIEGEDYQMPKRFFDEHYVPIHDTTVDIGGALG